MEQVTTFGEFSHMTAALQLFRGAAPAHSGTMEGRSGIPSTEESCPFSQQDLQANLSAWLDKAAQTPAQ